MSYQRMSYFSPIWSLANTLQLGERELHLQVSKCLLCFGKGAAPRARREINGKSTNTRLSCNKGLYLSKERGGKMQRWSSLFRPAGVKNKSHMQTYIFCSSGTYAASERICKCDAIFAQMASKQKGAECAPKLVLGMHDQVE